MTPCPPDNKEMKNATLPSPPPRQLASEDIAWLEQSVANLRGEWERVRRNGTPAEKAQVLASLSGCIADLVGPAAALRLSRRAHNLFKSGGTPEAIAGSGAVLAARLLDAGRPQEALRQSAEAREAMSSLGEGGSKKKVMMCLGREFLAAGYVVEAQAWLEIALEGLEGEERAQGLARLARALELQDKVSDALRCEQEAGEIFHHLGERTELGLAMVRLARLHMRLDQKWQAGSLCLEAIRILGRRRRKEDVTRAKELYSLCEGGRRPRVVGH